MKIMDMEWTVIQISKYQFDLICLQIYVSTMTYSNYTIFKGTVRVLAKRISPDQDLGLLLAYLEI